MNRNDFAAGKKEDEEAKPDARAKAKVTEKQAQAGGLKADGSKMVGPGHAAATKSLIPNSFIEKMDGYLPEKKK